MAAPVTAFVFPGLNGAGHGDDHGWLLQLPGFRKRWQMVAAAFATAPEFARFDVALRGSLPLPTAVTAWPWRALAVTAMQLAAAEALEQRGERADWLCGYSIGDIARSCHARVASFDRVVAFAAALPPLPPARGGTAALHTANADLAERLLPQLASVGVAVSRLSPRFLLVAGADTALRAARTIGIQRGAHWRDLGGCPLHAPEQERLARLLAAATRGVTLAAPQRAIYSTLWGRSVRADDDLCAEFPSNVASPVDFAAAVARLRRHHGVTRFVDLGPGRHAQRFVRHHGADVEAVHAGDLLAVTAAPG